MRKLDFISTLFIILLLSSCSTSYLIPVKQIDRENFDRDGLILVKENLKKPIKLPKVDNLILNNNEVLEEDNQNNYSPINQTVNNIFLEAKTYLGTPYRYGGTTRKGMDCSSFMQHIYKIEGIFLPRVSSRQARIGVPVSKGELRKGDLVFFSTTSRYRITHVGMVTDVSEQGIQFIHAASSKGVSFSTLNNPYWNRRYRGARRPHKLNELTVAKTKTIDSLITS